MEQIKYERLTQKNVQTIDKNIEINGEIYDIKTIGEFIKHKNNYIFVGLSKNEIVAFLYGYGLDRPDNKKMFYIHSVDVTTTFQGKKIGTGLIEYVINFIKKRGYYKYFVLADTDNLRANGLYKKFANQKSQNLYEGRL